MALKDRTKKKVILGNLFVFSPVSTQFMDNVQREYPTRERTAELIEIEKKLEDELTDIDKDSLKLRKEELEKILKEINPPMTEKVIMECIRKTPDCPTYKELQSDNTLFNMVDVEVGAFLSGNEYYDKQPIEVFKRKLVKLGKKSVKANKLYKILIKLEEDILSGEDKKKK